MRISQAKVMNWTSREPIENLKCIVETRTGSTFPALYDKGTWWNALRPFPVEGVVRWIAYPQGEEPNDYIPPEVLLKYAMKSYREEHGRLEEIRGLNRQLCTSYNKMREDNQKLRRKNEELKASLKEEREQSQKLGGIFKKIHKAMLKFAGMKVAVDENQPEEENVE